MADTDHGDSPIDPAASEDNAALDPRRAEAHVNGVAHHAFDAPHAPPAEPAARAAVDPGQVLDASGKTPRFRIFIVDSGWNSAARRALHDNFHLIRDLEPESPIYCLGRERSIELMRRYPALVGKDPIIRVHCEVERKHRKPGFHGFRLHLGLVHRHEKAIQALQNFAQFVGMHRHSKDLEADMRKKLRMEGLQGAIEIVMRGDAHGVGI